MVENYLLDFSAFEKPPGELRLEWTDSGDSFVTSVSISHSNDLTRWQTLVSKAALASLRYGEHNLGKNTISLPRHPMKYLRLSWDAGRQNIRLTDVKAIFLPVAAERSRQHIRINGKPVSDAVIAYEFDTQGRFPIDRINVHLPQRNSLVRAVLKSRPDGKSLWQTRFQGIFYNLQMEGTTLVNDTVSLSPVSDRYWRLEIGKDSSGMGKGMPILEAGWMPHELLFLARGEEPFKLAYGSTRVDKPLQPVDMLLNAIDDTHKTTLIRNARLDNKIELGGKSLLKPPLPPFPWKKWILWGVLIIGVLVLGWMAWQLYRQMN